MITRAKAFARAAPVRALRVNDSSSSLSVALSTVTLGKGTETGAAMEGFSKVQERFTGQRVQSD